MQAAVERALVVGMPEDRALDVDDAIADAGVEAERDLVRSEQLLALHLGPELAQIHGADRDRAEAVPEDVHACTEAVRKDAVDEEKPHLPLRDRERREMARGIGRPKERGALRMLHLRHTDIDDLDAKRRLRRLEEEVRAWTQKTAEVVAREDEAALGVAHAHVEEHAREVGAPRQRRGILRDERLEGTRGVDAERVPRLEQEMATRIQATGEDAIDVEQPERAGVDLHNLEMTKRVGMARDPVCGGMRELFARRGGDDIEVKRALLVRRVNEHVGAGPQESDEHPAPEREATSAFFDLRGGGDTTHVLAVLDRLDVGKGNARIHEKDPLDAPSTKRNADTVRMFRICPCRVVCASGS